VNFPALDFAKYYKSIGWPVFPLSPRKKSPATQHGFHDASLDDAQIEQWWGGDRAAQRFGIGIPTGKASGLIVVDIDARNGGWGSIERLKAEGKFLPDNTIQVNTSGERMNTGRHYYFRYPAGAEVLPGLNGAWPGIDIKSDGGYVAVPPSTHPTGIIYDHVKACQEVELADLPDWILEKMQQSRSSEGKRGLSDMDRAESGMGSKIREGGRNTHLTRVAGWLRREGHPPESILATVWEVNRTLCAPPVSEKEVKRIVWSVTRYAPNPEAAIAAVEPAPIVIKLLTGSDLRALEIPEPDWLLENRLAQGDICVMCGAPEAGKSWFAMDLALSAATMKPIYGLEPIFGRLRTLMLDEENTLEEIQRRYNKLCVGHGLNGAEADEVLANNFKIANQTGMNFNTPDYLAWVIERVREFQPHIITIDSATAMSGVRNENDAAEVRAFFVNKLYPIRKVCNSTIIVIHHTNKMAYQDATERTVKLQGLIRGSIDWLGAADSALLLMKEGDEDNPFIRLYQAKQRRGFSPPSLKIRLLDTQEGGTIPMVFDLPTQGATGTRRRQGKQSKRTQGIVAILEWLESQDVTPLDTIPKSDIIAQTLLWVSGTSSPVERKDLHNAMTGLVQKGILLEVEEGGNGELSNNLSNKKNLMRLTISKEQIVSRLRSMK
jgi:hypothetical protein